MQRGYELGSCLGRREAEAERTENATRASEKRMVVRRGLIKKVEPRHPLYSPAPRIRTRNTRHGTSVIVHNGTNNSLNMAISFTMKPKKG